MGVFEMVAIIVVAVTIGEMYKHHTKAQRAQPNTELQARVEELEDHEQELLERIQTLEEIITDDKYELDRQIKALK